MTIEPTPLTGPDLAKGIDIGEVPASSPLLGHVQGEAVVVVRSGHEFFAVSGTCPHYGGPLAEGLVEHETIRCPWHHACFNLRTDVAISYVGHAEQWDQADAAGSLQERNYTLALRKGEKTLAVITVGRDLESLRAEVAFERVDNAALAAIGK